MILNRLTGVTKNESTILFSKSVMMFPRFPSESVTVLMTRIPLNNKELAKKSISFGW